MSGNLWCFFRGLAVWAALVFLPFGIAVLRSGSPMQIGDLAGVLPLVLCGVLIIFVCSLFAGEVGPVASASLGAPTGIILMIASGILWGRLAGGFEASAGTGSGYF
jgi:hypothetical protein